MATKTDFLDFFDFLDFWDLDFWTLLMPLAMDIKTGANKSPSIP